VYVGPYLVVNAWLVVITLLHHTDPNVPFYDETSWTWLNGKKLFKIKIKMKVPYLQSIEITLRI
jgi:fatty acid desaturase